MLATALAEGAALELAECARCTGAVPIDRLSASGRMCTHCQRLEDAKL